MSYDIKYLISQNVYEKNIKIYNFSAIDYFLEDSNMKYHYQNLKKIWNQHQNEMDNTFSLLIKNIENKIGKGRDKSFEEKIELTTFDEYVYSNTITIIIDGFKSEDKAFSKKWIKFIDYFDKETMFYQFRWPSDSNENIMKDGNLSFIKNISKNFAASKNRAKICGKMLAYILMSFKFFKNFQINLIGFSLGNHVIKHCIKEVYKINNLNKKSDNIFKFKNIICIAAATHIENKLLWASYIEDLVIDKFINCYSSEDSILKLLYTSCMLKDAVGNSKLIIKNEKGVNLVNNYDFTKNKFGHRSYDFKILAERVFGTNKDI